MTKDLILHPQTDKSVQNFLTKPSQSVILLGPVGSGKTALALSIAANLLQIIPEKIASYQYLYHIAPKDLSITIEMIRDLQVTLRLTTIGSKAIRRVVFIEDAQYLTEEAQNALLKVLEEPPLDTVLILTSASRLQLLPTILSRSLQLQIKLPMKEDIVSYFLQKGFKQAEFERMYHISGGLPGLLTTLLQKDQEHPLLSQIEQAKRIVQSTIYERLLLTEELSKQKNELNEFLWALEKVLHAALAQAVMKGNNELSKKWHASLAQVMRSQGSLRHHPNSKLLLTNLMLQL